MNYILTILLVVTACSLVFGGVVVNKKSQVPVNPFLHFSFLPQNNVGKLTGDFPCEENHLNFCTNNFAKSLNLTDLPSKAIDFYYYILALVRKKGFNGFEPLCKATDDFVDCLGKSFDTCISVQYLVSIGIDITDASGYATLAQELKFMCGPAYAIFYEHYQCVVASLRTNTNQLFICNEKFNSSVHADPKNVCSYLQTFTECNVNVFKDCGADLTTAICQTFKIGYGVSIQQCEINCVEEQRSQARLTQKKIKLNG